MADKIHAIGWIYSQIAHISDRVVHQWIIGLPGKMNVNRTIGIKWRIEDVGSVENLSLILGKNWS